MVTGEHVEVYREAVAVGERRRYTKRFLNTPDGDFGQWTEREWRILARLIGHGIACVPDVVQFDRGRLDGVQLVQTYDAGVTVDQWATVLPVTRDGRVYGHVFEDCAHWWALAHHCLLALDVIHPLELVHLDIKGDNVCIPYTPASFDPDSSDLQLQPVFGQLALIDFAFALISRASLTTPLPLGWQKDYDYQSPRLLAALEAGRNGDLQLTRELDWRCDLYSLAAMLKRYLPDENRGARPPRGAGWTEERYDAAKALILRIREFHDGDLPAQRPHAGLIEVTGARLREEELARSLEKGWTLAREASVSPASASPLTPVTRLAPPICVTRSGRVTAVTVMAAAADRQGAAQSRTPAVRVPMPVAPPRKRYDRLSTALIAMSALAAVGAALWYADDGSIPVSAGLQAMLRPDVSADDERAAPQPSRESDDGARRRDTDIEKPAAAVSAEPRDAVAQPASAGEGAVAAAAPAVPTIAAASPAAETAVAPAPTADTPGSSSPDAATAPAESSSRATRDTPTTARAQPRIPESPALEFEARKSLPATPPKQASAAQRSAEKASRAQVAAALRAPQSRSMAPKEPKEQKEPKEPKEPKERVYAPWASLEPPAWALSSYRGKGPGVPRGASTSEPRALASTSSPDAAPAQPVSLATATTRNEPANSAVQLASAAAAAPASQRASLANPSAVIEAPRVAPAPPPALPVPVFSAMNADRAVRDDFAALGRQTLRDAVPRIAARAEPQVARVLAMAASAYHLTEERAVADASRATRVPDDALSVRTIAAAEARRLNDEARAAIRLRRDVREAMELQVQAFGADPRDPEIAGNLASLYLKLTPAQPEMARQIALVALAARGPQYHSARMEDWHTFAIASALSGRESDARNALFVTLALTADVDTRCTATLNALASYGERMRKPVEAMFYRLHTQGRGIGSQACPWPPNGSVVSRLQ